MADFDRERLLRSLETLGGDDDTEVLAAARDLHKQVADAGLDWADLLRVDVGADDGYEDEDVEDDYEDEPDELKELGPEDPDASAPVGGGSDDLATIEALLRRPNLYEGTRDELEAYKEDIAEGEFTAADRRYLHALVRRLSGQKKRRGR